MSTAPYTCSVLIGADSDFDFVDLRNHLCEVYRTRPKGDRARYNSERIILSEKRWNLRIRLSEESHVLGEAQELAQEFLQGDPRQAAVARCRRRLELAGDSDKRVLHAHHSFIALDAIRRYRDVYVFDPMQPAFV
jgi:hypothetical protein